MLGYLLITKSTVCFVLASISVLDKGVLPLEKNSVAIQFYIDVENENHKRDCKAHSRILSCCLTNEKESDCNAMTVYGINNITITPEDRATLIHVYPTLYHYDQIGYCEFVINYKCVRGRRNKIEVNIPFDTRLVNKKTPYMVAYKDDNSVECDTLDNDSLNDCKEINCDLKYAGEKPFYDINSSKCLRAPACICDIHKELPDIVYVPKSNICRDFENPLTVADIYAMSTGLGIITEPPSIKEDVKIELKSNCSTISQNLMLLKDMMCGKLCPLFNANTSGYMDCCVSAIISILGCIIAVCAAILAFACCVHTIIWFYLKWSKGDLKDCYQNFKSKMGNIKIGNPNPSRINKEVTNALLKEVLVRDLPLEIRESMVDICDRIKKEVKWKKRYRINDLGSQINLNETASEYTASSEEASDSSEQYDAETTKRAVNK